MAVILIINLACSLLLTGIVWFVQIVHYPLFHKVGRETFKTYENSHQRLTSYVVVPLMLGELVSAVLMIITVSDKIPVYLAWLNLVFVAVIWITTFSLQVPLHRKLTKGYDRKSVGLLVKTNAIRVVFWTLKSILVIYLWQVVVR